MTQRKNNGYLNIAHQHILTHITATRRRETRPNKTCADSVRNSPNSLRTSAVPATPPPKPLQNYIYYTSHMHSFFYYSISTQNKDFHHHDQPRAFGFLMFPSRHSTGLDHGCGSKRAVSSNTKPKKHRPSCNTKTQNVGS